VTWRAHLHALKRFIVSSTFTWKEAIEFLAQARPELKGCLPVITIRSLQSRRLLHSIRAQLRLKNYVKWQDTVLDTTGDLLRVKKELSVAAQ
jgi:hypothetical protein